MDSIGELGLGTGQFNQAADQAIERLKSLGMEAVALSGGLAGLALVLTGVLAKAVYDAKKAAEELDSTFQDIKNSTPFSTSLTSVAELEGKIKSLNTELKKIDEESIMNRIGRFIGSAHLLGGEGFDKAESDLEGERAERVKEIEKTIKEIGQKEQENTRVLQLQLEGRKEEAELLKSKLKFENEIAQARAKGLPDVAAELAKQRDITAELIKQKALLEKQKELEEWTAGINKKRKDEARAQNEDEKNALKRQEDIAKQNKKREDEAKKDTEKALSEAQKSYDDKVKDRENAEKKLTKEAEKQAEEAAKRLAFNRQITEELRAQTREMSAARSGNPTDAKRERMENKYDQQIKDAVRRGDKDSERALIEQRDMEREDLDVEEAKKTPRQRAEERKAERKDRSDRKKAEAREAEQEQRARRGADSEEIARRRKIGRDERKRADGIERVRNEPKTTPKGFDEAAAKNLQDIADAFRNKGK